MFQKDASVAIRQGVFPMLLPACYGWRVLDQEGLWEQGGCGWSARVAEGSTKSELVLVPGAA